MNEDAELVKVLNDRSLIDSESYQRTYQTRVPLLPGYYVVVWKGDDARRAYDDDAQYVGPYCARSDARVLLEGNRVNIQGGEY
jgi:hypothetical protein